MSPALWPNSSDVLAFVCSPCVSLAVWWLPRRCLWSSVSIGLSKHCRPCAMLQFELNAWIYLKVLLKTLLQRETILWRYNILYQTIKYVLLLYVPWYLWTFVNLPSCCRFVGSTCVYVAIVTIIVIIILLLLIIIISRIGFLFVCLFLVFIKPNADNIACRLE